MAAGERLDHASAAECHARRGQTHDEQVAARERDLVLQAQLRPGLLARPELVAIEQRQARQRLGRAGVKADLRVVPDRVARPRPAAAARRWRASAAAPWRREHLTASQVLDRHAAEIDGRAGAAPAPSRASSCGSATRARAFGDRLAALPAPVRARSSPSISVPVTTVPNPATVKMRSIGSRGRPVLGRAALAAQQLLERELELVEPLARRRRSTRTIGRTVQARVR